VEEGLPVELMGWATPQQLGFYEYMRRRYEQGSAVKRLTASDTDLLRAQLEKLKKGWVEDATHRRTLGDLCGQLLLDSEQVVPLTYGETEGTTD